MSTPKKTKMYVVDFTNGSVANDTHCVPALCDPPVHGNCTSRYAAFHSNEWVVYAIQWALFAFVFSVILTIVSTLAYYVFASVRRRRDRREISCISIHQRDKGGETAKARDMLDARRKPADDSDEFDRNCEEDNNYNERRREVVDQRRGSTFSYTKMQSPMRLII